MIERELGFADTPNAIQCRKCGKIKPNTHLHFRQVKSSARLVTTCIACERKDPNRRTKAALAKRISNIPLSKYGSELTEKERLVLLERELKAQQVEQATGHKTVRDATRVAAFKAQWALVRAVISERRAQLAARAATPGYLSNPRLEDVTHYLRLVIGVERDIVQRMAYASGWYDAVQGHYPPGPWLELGREFDNLRRRENAPGAVAALITRLSPWVFTQPSERSACLAALPTHTRWLDVSERLYSDSSTFLHHAIPWEMPLDPNTGTRPAWNDPAACPPWLRKYNGS